MVLTTSLIILYCLGVIICFVTFWFMDALTNKRIDRIFESVEFMKVLNDIDDTRAIRIKKMQKELDALSAQVNEMQMERK